MFIDLSPMLLRRPPKAHIQAFGVDNSSKWNKIKAPIPDFIDTTH